MTDYRIQSGEKMVGAGHATLSDTLNRLSLVEHNNDGTHNKLTKVTDPWVDVRAYGAVCDGVTDDSTAIQNAINAVYNSGSYPSGGTIILPAKTINLGTTGITLYEGIVLQGMGRRALVSNAIIGGTWLKYTGTGNAITIDGEWTGFLSRRDIHIRNLGIFTQSGVNSAIYADFLASFNFDDIFIYGSSTYGIYATNTYNGTLNRLKVQGCGTGLYSTIKISLNDVFSGQMLIIGCDFWDNTSKGVHFDAPVNTFAEVTFIKTHFKTNAYGAYLEGSSMHNVNFRGCHFEGNTTEDLYIHSDVTQAPTVDGCHFNNLSPIYKINNQGDKGVIVNNTFTGSSTGYGIKINGDDNYIALNHFQGITCASSAGQIFIDTSANYNTIGKNTHSITSNRVVDSSTSKTTYFEGEELIESKTFTLSAGQDIDTKFYALRDYWIQDAVVMYPTATSSDTGVILQFGDSADVDRYISLTSASSATAYSIETPTLLATYIARGRNLRFTCAGSKVGAGTAKIVVRVIPFTTI